MQLLSGLALLLLFVASWANVARSYQTLAFCLLNCLFIRVFVRKWELTERQLAAEWGVTTLEASLDARPQFRGELKRCYITHHVEPHYPPSRRLAKRIATTIALSALTLGFLAVYYLLVTSDAWVAFYERSVFNVQVGNVLLTLLTRCTGTPLARLSTWTNDWENYKTQDDYDANLTLKCTSIVPCSRSRAFTYHSCGCRCADAVGQRLHHPGVHDLDPTVPESGRLQRQ